MQNIVPLRSSLDAYTLCWALSKYTKMSFPDDASVIKSVFLALREITRKWAMPIRNWNLVVNQFINIFGERCKI
jgi:putative transposase